MTAVEFAKANGFEDAELIGTWNGEKVYAAIFRVTEDKLSKDGESLTSDDYNIGFPQYILERNGRFRFAGYDEAMKILRGMEVRVP